MIVVVLQILAAVGSLPPWLSALMPFIIKYGPYLEPVLLNLVKILIEEEKKHGSVVIGQNNQPSMIPGYGPHGELILIPNPDYKPK